MHSHHGSRHACQVAHRHHRHPARCRKKHARHATRRHGAAQRVLAPTPPPAAPRATAPATVQPGPSLAEILATPCQGTELMPAPANLAVIRAATLCLVNQERARNGEQPLRGDAALEAAAQGHSAQMIEQDYFAHVSPGGETPLERIQAAGYIPNPQAGYAIGENIAWGTLGLATPSAIVAAWIASPEHLANILDASYQDSGIGIVAQAPSSLAGDQAGAMYTQTFGVIIN
ncbi:MAG TPA: CAP domain-containing protein [Solirubrobacteraceae bacterium]|jgi:uncharacterized protein YkwD